MKKRTPKRGAIVQLTKAVVTEMDRTSSDEITTTAATDAEPVRRRGDRRVADQVVTDDRRKGDRRDTPGFGALIRTLFRRGPGPTP